MVRYLQTRCSKFVNLIVVLVVSQFYVQGMQAQSSVLQSSLSGAFDVTGITEKPVLFSADSLGYKNRGEIVEAKGNVEIRQADRIILADRLVFNRTTEEIMAIGNVSIQDGQGNVMRTEKVALDRHFSRGFMQQVQLVLAPDIRFAANYAERSGGDKLSLYKSVFSPCPECSKDPSKAPLWQLKAGEIVLDEKRQQVFYKNISFELAGIPVLYLPFFAHPDPRVERQSGFLMPSIESGSDLGTGLKIPYFVDLGESRDVTVEPAVYFGLEDNIGGHGGLGGATLEAEFRQALPGGRLSVTGYSVIESEGAYLDNNLFGTNDDQFNTAVRVSLTSDLGRNTRIKGNYAGWTNREYFNELGISSDTYGQRDLEIENFWRRSYGSIEAVDQYVLRNLASTVATGETMPDLAAASYAYQSEPLWGAATVGVNTQVKGLYRETGRDYLRVSTNAQVNLPFNTPIGLKTTLTAGGFGAFYKIQQADNTNNLNTAASTYEDDISKFHPAASVRLEWPMASNNGDYDQIVEPIVQAVYAGKGQNSNLVPNEDSVAVRLGEGNMFNLWRTNGIDKIDSGSRVDYGLRYSLYNESDSWLRVFVGQSLRLEDAPTNLWGTGSENDFGLEDDMSHIIGSVTFEPGDVFDATWRFAYDLDTNLFYDNNIALALKTDRISATAAYETGRLNTTALNLERMSLGLQLKPFDSFGADFTYTNNLLVSNDVKYTGKLTIKPTDRLTFTTGYGYQELIDKQTFSSSIAYTHPCLNFSITGERDILSNGTVDDEFGFMFGLKYLGDSDQLSVN